MKKTISLLLALLIVMSLPLTAFATDNVSVSGGTKSADVKGTYSGSTPAPVYSVDISWEGLDFTYNAATKGNWNADTHTYSGGTVAGWAAGTGTITITNHSNADITAVPSYTKGSGYENANMNFSSNTLTVATADNGTNGAPGSAVTETITVTPTGSLPSGTNNATIGQITIKIS